MYEADYKIKDSLGNILSVEWIYHSLPSRHPIVGKILFPCLFFFAPKNKATGSIFI